jgi:hypothetical protein
MSNYKRLKKGWDLWNEFRWWSGLWRCADLWVSANISAELTISQGWSTFWHSCFAVCRYVVLMLVGMPASKSSKMRLLVSRLYNHRSLRLSATNSSRTTWPISIKIKLDIIRPTLNFVQLFWFWYAQLNGHFALKASVSFHAHLLSSLTL